ncbi:unnamed protein product [Discula destructiva]
MPGCQAHREVDRRHRLDHGPSPFNSKALRPQQPAASIAFKYPGYTIDNVLFTLPRLDVSPQAAPAGVHHGTALLACQIIANNAFEGFLATDRGGSNRVSVPLDGVLLEDGYWFIAGGRPDGHETADVYPIVPIFEEWQFPHSHVASLRAWEPSPNEVLDRSARIPPHPMAPPPPPEPPSLSRCILSHIAYTVQRAHLVPTAQSDWFQANVMKQYGDLSKRLFIHTERNKVPMRHDLHKLWDDHIFALVPKLAGQGPRPQFVVHTLSVPDSTIAEFAGEWHNRPVQDGALDGAAKAYLFAKFAQAVFMLLKSFIAFSAEPRFIVTFQTVETKTAWLSRSTLSMLYSGGG